MEKGNEDKTKQIENRLSKIVGQLKAIKRMTEEKRGCSEVLIQISAAKSALDSVAKIILQDHINTCIQNAIEKKEESAIDDLNNIISKFLY